MHLHWSFTQKKNSALDKKYLQIVESRVIIDFHQKKKKRADFKKRINVNGCVNRICKLGKVHASKQQQKSYNYVTYFQS